MIRREFTSTRVLDAPREGLDRTGAADAVVGPKDMSTPLDTIEVDLPAAPR